VLTDLLAERLLIADMAASAKYGTERPIDDVAREQKILDAVAARAANLGLSPDLTVAIFHDQIEANKLVQRGLYVRWNAHSAERPTRQPDLDKEVRPILDRITTQLLETLVATENSRMSASCKPRLYVASVGSAYAHKLDALHLQGLRRALLSLCVES
jgi:chorismate mutase